MRKKIVTIITVFTFIIFNTVGVFAHEHSDIRILSQGDTQPRVETLMIHQEEYTYKSQENIKTRQIEVFDSENKKIATVVYDKSKEKLFVDGKEIPVDVELHSPNSYTSLDNFSIFNASTTKSGDIGPWQQFGKVEYYKYNIASHLGAAVAIAGIAVLVGGPVGAFLGMYSVWEGSKTNCSVKKTTYIRNYYSKSQLKYVADVYRGRNYDEYFYTATWQSSPH